MPLSDLDSWQILDLEKGAVVSKDMHRLSQILDHEQLWSWRVTTSILIKEAK